MAEQDKPIRISGEQYETLRDLKMNFFGTESATFKEVVGKLIDEYEDKEDG